MEILGEGFLQWLVLALGGAMAAGNILALVRPRPPGGRTDELSRPPLARSLVMITLGTVAAVWALASLASG